MFGKKENTSSPLQKTRYVTTIEYIAIAMSRIGGMFSTTLTGTLAAAFLHELYYGPVGVGADGVAAKLAVQTTITTIGGILIGIISGVIVQKWKSGLGHYRQWYFINLIPMFVLTVLFFWVPEGWDVEKMTYLRYGVALAQTIFGAFNTLSQNLVQVISPDPGEKKTIATCWQLFYYIGYGSAYLATFVYGLFSDDKIKMYMRLAIVAAVVAAVGNLMCGIFCKERVEVAPKGKEKLTKDIIGLFRYRNYRCYTYITFANNLATLGTWSTYLAAITVGSSKNLLLTLPTAAGTVVGNIITAKLSKKYEPTKLLRFCGIYSFASAALVFFSAFIEAKFNIQFFSGTTAIFFYIFYFLFGMGIGVQELSTSHFNVEFYDYLEWQTGKRMEAVQGIIPGWVNQALIYGRQVLIPYILLWVGYEASAEGDLLKTMQAKPDYLNTCVWLLGLLVFTYAASCVLRAVFLKFLYDVEGEKKEKMYKDLEIMRAGRNGDTQSPETEPVA